MERRPRAWIAASSGLGVLFSLWSKLPERRLRSGAWGVIVRSGLLNRLLNMLMLLVLLLCVAAGCNILVRAGLMSLAAAGGVSMLVAPLVILISSMAKIPLSLWAWISWSDR